MAHTFDLSTYTNETKSLAVTNVITPSAGSTLVVLCICDASITNTVPRKRTGGDPTFGGRVMNFVLESSIVGGETWNEMWYVVSPSTGAAYTISVPNTSNQQMQLHVSSYKAGAGFTSTIDVSAKSTSSAANPSLSITPSWYGTVGVGFLGSGRNALPSAVTGTWISGQYVATHSGSSQYILIDIPRSTAFGWTVATDDQAMIVATWKERPLPNLILKVAGDPSTQISKIAGLAYASVHSVCRVGGSSATAPSK
jgi:hypothetical protein